MKSTRKPSAAKARASPRKSRGEGAALQVQAYLARLPADKREALERLRRQVLAVVPEARETIAYGIPTFVRDGRNLVHMAAFRAHCSFFPGSGSITQALAKELAAYVVAKGTIRFTPERPLPAALVKRIVRLRVAEEKARATRKPAAKTGSRTRQTPDARRRSSSAGAGRGGGARG